MNQNRELIEFSWDERTGISTFLYENQNTGELDTNTAHQPLVKPEVTEEVRASYFANLQFWLSTQPLYD